MEKYIWRFDGSFICIKDGEITIAGVIFREHSPYNHDLSINQPKWTLVEDLLERMFSVQRAEFEKMFQQLKNDSEGYRISAKLLNVELNKLRKEQKRLEDLLEG